MTGILHTLRRGAFLAFFLAVVAGGLAFMISRRQPPVYAASVSLVSAQPRSSFGTLELVVPPQVDARAYEAALMDGAVVSDALARVDGLRRTEAELRAFRRNLHVTVENQQVSGLVRIEVRQSDPELAATYANEIAVALIDWDRSRGRQVVESTVIGLERSIAEIDQRLVQAAQEVDQAEAQRQQVQLATLREQRARELETARARGRSAVVVSSLEVVSPADVPQRAVGPRAALDALVAFAVGLLLGYGLQLARWSLADEVLSRKRLADVSGTPVLAEFPKAARRRPRGTSDSGSYLRTNIIRGAGGADRLIIGMTSARSYFDKEYVSASLAERFATSGYRVLLIDADLRRQGPGLGIPPARMKVPGFDAYLQTPGRPVQPVQVDVSKHKSFDFVPSNAPTKLSSELMELGLKDFLEATRSAYDVVILDLAPVLALADALVAAPHCNVLVLCASVSSRRVDVAEAAKVLRHAGGNLVGTVLTGVRGRARTRTAALLGPEAVAANVRTDTRAGLQPWWEAEAVASVRQRG